MKGVNRTEIVFLVFMIVMIVACGTGVYFLTNSVLANKQEIANLTQQITLESSRRQRLTDIARTYEQTSNEGYTEKFDELLPGEDEFLDVVREIEQIATDTGGQIALTLGSARLTGEGIDVGSGGGVRAAPNVAVRGNGYAIVKIQATLRSNFDGAIEFFRYVNDAKYFFNITSVSVRRVSVSEGQNQIDTAMTIDIYVDELLGV